MDAIRYGMNNLTSMGILSANINQFKRWIYSPREGYLSNGSATTTSKD